MAIFNFKFSILDSRRGMTMFIAVVIVSVLLLVSFAVINITVKNTIFASYGRDSQYAFYAADAGMECAIYWDSTLTDGSAFATSTPGSITCAGQTITTGSQNPISGTTTASLIGGGGDAQPTSVFGFSFNQGSNPVPYCAIVTVTKKTNGQTYIKSRGYNTCDSSLRRVERGIEVTY